MTATSECVSSKMQHMKDEDKSQKEKLAIAYHYCQSKTDFVNTTPEEYDLMRKDAISQMPAQWFEGAQSGGKGRIEPMKSLATAATGGKHGSSNVEKVGYFNSMLEVEFKNGARYVYFVGPEFYDSFVKAPSKGKFVWNSLRGKMPGLVFDDPTRTTPGGVGSKDPVHKPYSKGTGGTPDATGEKPYEPQIPKERERKLTQTLTQQQFSAAGLKWQKMSLPKADMVKMCDDCKKEKPLFYQKLCKGCYNKRVEHYKKVYDMNEKELKKIIKRLEKETEGMTEFEKETYYRAHLMEHFSTATVKTDLDDDKGRWITMRGTHVFIKEGETPKEAIMRKVAGFEAEKQDKEEQIRKHMEEQGSTRETAEKEVGKSVEQEKRVEKVKKVDKRLEKEKKQVDEAEVKQKQILLNERISHLRQLNQGKSGARTFMEVLGLLADMVMAAKKGRSVMKSVQTYINKIERDRTIEEKQRQKYVKQIQQLHGEIKEMTEQQDMINIDKIPIKQELEHLDMIEYVEMLEEIEFLDMMGHVEMLETVDFFTNDFDLDECVGYYTGKGKSQEDAENICGAVMGKIAGAKKKKKEADEKKKSAFERRKEKSKAKSEKFKKEQTKLQKAKNRGLRITSYVDNEGKTVRRYWKKSGEKYTEITKKQYDKLMDDDDWEESWKKTEGIMSKQRKARARYKQHKAGEKTVMQRSIYGTYDTDHWDLTMDFVDTMEGPITRAGPFEYGDEILYKDWNNLKEVFSKIDHVPLIGSKGEDSHLDKGDRIIGFAHNFKLNDKTKQVLADVETFKEIEQLSDLKNPSNLPVSIGFKDEGEGNIQKITGIKHLAMSLNALETDRCSSAGGLSCTVSKKTGPVSDSNDLGNLSLDGSDTIKNKKIKNDFIMPDKKEEVERDDAMEDGSGTKVPETGPEQLFMRRCIDGGHSQEYCSQAWNAKKKGGEEQVKTGEGAKQDPTKHKSSDFMEISKDEYADLIAAAKTLNDSKDFIEKLKKREEKVLAEEKDTLTKFFVEDRKIVEDFVKKRSLCDLKLLKAYDDLLPKLEEEAGDLQDFNNQRLLDELGSKKNDFAALEETYRKQALERLGVKQ